VRGALRSDALNATLGLLVVVAGLIALALFALRKRSKDPALIWFGLFAVIYGTRLLLDTGTVRFTLGIDDHHGQLARSLLTYVIPIAGGLFGYSVFAPWRRVLKWYLGFSIPFAVIGITTDLVTGRPWSLQAVNTAVTLIAWGAFTFAVFLLPSLQVAGLRWATLVWGITIIIVNLRGLGLPGLPFNPEYIGFACFLFALGRLLAQRSFETEDRLRELSKELEIATRIQLSILPREMPDSAEITIAAKYVPMTEVAGDFYDFLRIDDRHLGILIADVSGHGVPAALIASMVKVAIAAQAPHADDPARVIAGINQILCGKIQGQFVSAAYLYIDLESLSFRYAAAGHPPLLWARAAEQRVESLEQNGLILGVFGGAPYTSTERSAQPGDRFLLYTDGLVEGANEADEFFGEERIRETLSQTTSLSAEQVAETLLERLGEFAGHKRGRSQNDDLTVIVIDLCHNTTEKTY
jgi:sigma-B regulation protein RsbU (phosphoserine phosphatase)